MHFDREPGEHSLGHEFVFVAQDEIIVAVPVIFRLVGGEELGGYVGAGTVGNFVAEFEILHELKQFVAHVAVWIVCPNSCKISMGKVSEIIPNFWSIENFVDGSCTPFWFEDDPIFQYGVFLEVETDTEIMEVAAKLEFIFTTFDAMAIT